MDHKERVLLAIHHHPPDRVPMDYRARSEVSQTLTHRLGVVGYDGLLERLDIDFRYIQPIEVIYERQRYKGPTLRTFQDGSWADIWGVRRKQVQISTGFYDEVCYSPLAAATTVEEVAAHSWPDPDWFDYSDIAEQCQRYKDYALVGGSWGAIFGDAYRLQGMETFLMNLALRPEVPRAIIERVEHFYYAVNKRIFDAANGQLDIYFFGNDFGTQQGLLISPKMFREFFAPGLARLAKQAKERGMVVMFHSCGAVRALVPDFIAAGIDILDPVQAQAANMDPTSLKAEFGQDICFHGGIDTQRLLPFSTAEQVRQRVQEVTEAVGKGGGYILAPDQALQGDVPLENVLAMYSTRLSIG
jgi:uroporphyrinogen decarboxylase